MKFGALGVAVHVKDEGVTKEHVRKWNVLQQLQVGHTFRHPSALIAADFCENRKVSPSQSPLET